MGYLNPVFSARLTASVETMAKIYQDIIDEAKGGKYPMCFKIVFNWRFPKYGKPTVILSRLM